MKGFTTIKQILNIFTMHKSTKTAEYVNSLSPREMNAFKYMRSRTAVLFIKLHRNGYGICIINNMCPSLIILAQNANMAIGYIDVVVYNLKTNGLTLQTQVRINIKFVY